MNQVANANLFSRLFDGLDDPTRLAIETLDGEHISYGDDRLLRAGRECAGVERSQAGRPRRRTEKSVTGRALSGDRCAGAVYLPLNTAYTLNELEYCIIDCGQSRRQGHQART
jgi:malonyl-CoA/methylmalonyl-CoA synthetase